VEAVAAAKDADHSKLESLLLEILAILKERPSPIASVAANVIKENAEKVKEFTENPDILAILKQILKEVTQINGDDIDNSVLAIVKNIKIQLSEVKDTLGETPARIIEIVNNILPGVNERITTLETKLAEDHLAVMKAIRKVDSNLQDLSGSLPDRFDEVLEEIRKIKPCPEPLAPLDYGPQFEHIDNSVKTLYATVLHIQNVVENDYTNRFDQLDRKMDELMALMRRC
jgi:hypothetical protein